jgi:hypothetical protein
MIEKYFGRLELLRAYINLIIEVIFNGIWVYLQLVPGHLIKG